MNSSSIYAKQREWLNSLFAELPQWVISLVVLIRVVVAVPLFLTEIDHMSFLTRGLAILLALVVVFSLEVLGLLASLLTAYFRGIGARTAFGTALALALASAAFNALLLWSNVSFPLWASVVFQAFNLLSFVLGEATGFLVVALQTNDDANESTTLASLQAQLAALQTTVSDKERAFASLQAKFETVTEELAAANQTILFSQKELAELSLHLQRSELELLAIDTAGKLERNPSRQTTAREMRQAGSSLKEIANALGISESTASRWSASVLPQPTPQL